MGICTNYCRGFGFTLRVESPRHPAAPECGSTGRSGLVPAYAGVSLRVAGWCAARFGCRRHVLGPAPERLAGLRRLASALSRAIQVRSASAFSIMRVASASGGGRTCLPPVGGPTLGLSASAKRSHRPAADQGQFQGCLGRSVSCRIQGGGGRSRDRHSAG